MRNVTEYLRGFARYPETKEVAGPKYWGTMHNAATQLPATLSESQIRTFHQWLIYTASHFVCDSCRDAVDWLKLHRPVGNRREDMIGYVCRLHNTVNDKTGKLLHDCGSITSEECHDCRYQSSAQEEVLNDAGTVPQAMGEFQQAALRVFEALCEREHVPVPPIRFGGCPEYPHRSCTIFHSGDATQAEIVLHPETFGLYSVVHEFLHYLRKLRGEDAGNEYEVGTLAQAIIESEFPALKVNKNPSVDSSSRTMLPTVPVMHETFPDSGMGLPIKPTITQDRMQSVYKRFPLYARRVADAQGRNNPPQNDSNPADVQEREARGGRGFLSGLDGVFRPIADAYGIPAHTVNTMHMANTIGTVINTIVGAGTSPFGSALVSLLGSAGLFAAGMFAKREVSMEDRKILFGILSSMFNHNINIFGNTKTRGAAMSGAEIAGRALSRLDFDLFFKSFFEDPAVLSQTSVAAYPSGGAIPPEQFQGRGRAPGPPPASAGPGMGFAGGGSGMPVGGGVGGHGYGGPDFDPYGNVLRGENLERRQQETFKRAIVNRPPVGMPNVGYEETPAIYPGQDFGGVLAIPELDDMNSITGGGGLERRQGYTEMNQLRVWNEDEEYQ